jgi:hypothetical protein
VMAFTLFSQKTYRKIIYINSFNIQDMFRLGDVQKSSVLVSRIVNLRIQFGEKT